MKLQLINQINKNYSPLEQVLTNRGIALQDIPHYLHLTAVDEHDPCLLDNIDKAIMMMLTHLEKHDNEILLVVDCDCDGYCSAALLLNYLYSILPSSIEKIRYVLHSDKSHGIIADAIGPQTSLVIAPDSSSNEYELHKELHDKGIDVLVLDHHHAEKVSEYACVVNNQLCEYPNKTLSGGGIAYKFCQRMDQICSSESSKDFLDLACVALVGDMMDIRDMETRYLIQEGMRDFRNPFLAAMKEHNAYSLGSELTPIGIAFYIVPFINAMTRSGTIEEKILLFESMLEWKAYDIIPSTKRGCKGEVEELVIQAVRTCVNVKNRQTRNRDADFQNLESLVTNDHKLLLLKAEGFTINRAIAGLIANELMSKYQRPVAILRPVQKEDGLYWEGSARGINHPELPDFRRFCEMSGYINYGQGHANAFGLSIKDTNFDDFVAWSDAQLASADFSPSYKVDFIYNANEPFSQVILDLGEKKHLWGQEIAEPMIGVNHISITKDMLALMSRDKNPTLKIELPNGVSCIKFKSSEEEYETLYSDAGCVTINLVGKAEVNRYYNSITPQLIIQDYEIINRQDYYF